MHHCAPILWHYKHLVLIHGPLAADGAIQTTEFTLWNKKVSRFTTIFYKVIWEHNCNSVCLCSVLCAFALLHFFLALLLWPAKEEHLSSEREQKKKKEKKSKWKMLHTGALQLQAQKCDIWRMDLDQFSDVWDGKPPPVMEDSLSSLSPSVSLLPS